MISIDFSFIIHLFIITIILKIIKKIFINDFYIFIFSEKEKYKNHEKVLKSLILENDTKKLDLQKKLDVSIAEVKINLENILSDLNNFKADSKINNNLFYKNIKNIESNKKEICPNEFQLGKRIAIVNMEKLLKSFK